MGIVNLKTLAKNKGKAAGKRAAKKKAVPKKRAVPRLPDKEDNRAQWRKDMDVVRKHAKATGQGQTMLMAALNRVEARLAGGDCPDCDGTGQRECEHCDGAGSCSHCGAECEECYGEGKEDCPSCNGSGDIHEADDGEDTNWE